MTQSSLSAQPGDREAFEGCDNIARVTADNEHGQTNQSPSRRVRRFALPCILLLVALATLPKLANDFVWDDLALIVESDFIHDFDNLPQAFAVDTMFAADRGKFQAIAQLDTYRPVTIATFFVDAALTGKRPLAYHLNNLLLHLICVSLVYTLGLRLLSPQRHHAVPWATLWFGLHPLLGEAHIWINGRSDLWCTAFGLAGTLVWFDSSKQASAGRRALLLVVSGVLFLLGLLSKETLLPALLVLMLWQVGLFERPLRNLDWSLCTWLRSLPMGVAILIYLLLRSAALSGMHMSAGDRQITLALERLPVLWLDGLWSAVVPTTVMPRYLDETYARLSSFALVACAALTLLLGWMVWRGRQRWPLFAFGLTWFLAVLAPACLIATLQWYGFGRYLYLPLTMLALGTADRLAVGLDLVRDKATPLIVRLCQVSLVGYVALLGLRLLESTRHWDGPTAFYTQIIAEQPDASHGYGGLGKWLTEQGRPDLGIGPLERAVELGPRDSRYLNNLGIAYLRTGRTADARRVAELGLQRFPDQPKFSKLRELAR